MESKTTSKTSSLKALLLRAWRERWTDLQWGINIKTVLRGVSGDVYNLADCILQQAVVGSGANQLALGYLKHSLSAQLVSHAAVLQRISKYSKFHKTHCIFSLLEFIEGILPGVTCYGRPDETVLASSLLFLAFWLLEVIQHCNETVDILEKTTFILKTLLSSDFYIAMMCVARYSETDFFIELVKKCEELELSLSDKEEVIQLIKVLKKLDVSSLPFVISTDKNPSCLIQAWIAVELVQRPGNHSRILIEQLRLLQRLKGCSDAKLYAELMKASLLSLQNASQTPLESHWGAFAFLKVPYVLAEMVDNSNCSSIVSAVEILLQHSPLIDFLDARFERSCLTCLLGELEKAKLLTDSQVQFFLQRREVPKLDSAPPNGRIPNIIICVKPTLAGILKTLTTDYHKNQEALVGMLHQILTGNSFELILAVATVQSELHTFATRLIRFNECSKIGNDKAKAQLFDICFLILVAIVQNYGGEKIIDPFGQSMLEQWISECMVEAKRAKSPEQLLRLCKPNIVDSLLQQFNAGESEFKNITNWQDILFNMSGVMKEVLMAWEQGILLPADVKRILDAVRGNMCCLAVAAAAWLCSYMRTAPQDTLLKPINMVQQLLTPPIVEDESLRDRWQLSCEIIRKMQRDIQSPLQPKSGCNVVFRQSATEQLHLLWTKAIERGWLDHNTARNIQNLLDMAGSCWLVTSIIRELLHLRYRDQLQRGVDLAVAIFQLDIYGCTIELLTHVLPQKLYNVLQSDSLMEPQLFALAHLTSCTIYVACDSLLMTDDKEVLSKKPNMNVDSIIRPLHHLFSALKITVQDGQMTQQTYFTFQLFNCLVDVSSPSTPLILTAIPAVLISDLLRILPELFTPALLLHLHDVNTHVGRTNMARDLCALRNYKLKNIF